MGCVADWCPRDEKRERLETRSRHNVRVWKVQGKKYTENKVERLTDTSKKIIWGKKCMKIDRERDRGLSQRERKQTVVFIFSSQCWNRKRTSGLINHESFHRGFVCYSSEKQIRGEGRGDREKEKQRAAGGRKKKEMLCNHMNFVLPLTNAHTYIHTPQPTSRLYVSFGLEVCGMGRGRGGGLHILLRPAWERLSTNEK